MIHQSKFKCLYSRKYVWKCGLWNVGHFVSASMCQHFIWIYLNIFLSYCEKSGMRQITHVCVASYVLHTSRISALYGKPTNLGALSLTSVTYRLVTRLIWTWREHNDVMTQKLFLYYCFLCGEFTSHQWTPLAKGQWCRALIFSLLLNWTSCWTDSGAASDLIHLNVHVRSV